MLPRLIVLLCFLSIFSIQNIQAQKELEAKEIKVKVKKEKQKEDVAVTVEEVDEVPPLTIKGSAKKWQKKGDALYLQGADYAAIDNYEIALTKTRKKKLKKTLFFKLGESAYAIRDYALAESYYKSSTSIDLKKKKLPLLAYQLANALKYQAKYEQAIKVYQSFLAEIDDNPKYAGYKSKARIEAKGCDYALNLAVEEVEYTVENPGDDVNGEFADFGPEIRGNELVFSKILKDYDGGDQNGNHLAKIYTSEMYKEQFNFAQIFSKSLNEGDAFVCNPSFSADNKTVYFTKCLMDKSLDSKCTIFKSTIENGVWSASIELAENINAPESSNSHPQIVVDENGKEFLFFSSDRSGGRGGKDIWMAALQEGGSFARARNLGAKINSRFDEISPFYVASSKSLYFSTDGKISLGGFDVYVATKSEDDWEEAIALPMPINTSLDDYDFVVDKGGEFGFLVSNRVGTITTKSPTCCDDIFIWRTTNIEIFLKGLVYAENSTSREMMKTALVSLKSIDSGEVDTLKYDGKFFITNLEKDAQYELRAENKDFEPVTLMLNTNSIVRSDTLQYDLFFKERRSFNNQIIGTIYYEYNQARLTKEAPKTLEQIVSFLQTYPKTTVEITAHTDDKGPAEYNLALSQERCLAAANYLNFQGISSNRIELKWVGETQPIAPNTNKDGSDNPEGRLLNRRTEFKIIN